MIPDEGRGDATDTDAIEANKKLPQRPTNTQHRPAPAVDDIGIIDLTSNRTKEIRRRP